MIVLNTTVGWQVGDDLIRRGVEDLLGLRANRDYGTYYVNRAQAEVPACRMTDGELEAPSAPWNPYHEVQRGRPSCHDVMRGARLFVCAGTPEWASRAEGWWAAAIAHRVPIALVGVGMPQGSAMVLVREAASRGLVVAATARDRAALGELGRSGVEARWYPCPATVGWPLDPSNRDRVDVLNPRLSCAGRPVRRDQLDFWARVAADPSYSHCRLVVHEPAEVAEARAMFGREPFFSSRAEDYADLYLSTRWYLGGRLHGALPVAAAGGAVNLLDAAPKFSAFWEVMAGAGMQDGDACRRVLTTDAPPPVARVHRADSMRAYLAAAASDHSGYLGHRLGRLLP